MFSRRKNRSQETLGELAGGEKEQRRACGETLQGRDQREGAPAMNEQEAMLSAFEKHWRECWRGVVRGEEEGKTKPVARECFFAGWILKPQSQNETQQKDDAE